MRSIAHFPYQKSTLEALVAKGHQVQLCFDKHWSKDRNQAHVDEWILKHGQKPFQWYRPRNDRWRALIFPLRELRSYANYLKRSEQSDFYTARWGSYLHPRFKKWLKLKNIKGWIFRKFIESKWVELLCRFVESRVPADKEIIRFINNVEADVMVITPGNMRFSEEVEYLKAAKKIKLPVVLPVYSWDNLTTKGLIHLEPDACLAWNQAHRREAVSIHQISAEKVHITGSPYFDRWFGEKNFSKEEIEDFYHRVGLDSGKPFITYLGSSRNIAKDESWIVEKLKAQLDQHFNVQILIRPHPANYRHFERLVGESVQMWPRPPFNFDATVPEFDRDVRDFFLSVELSRCLVGINTSAMLESVIKGKHVIAYCDDQYEATQVGSMHFRHLMDSEALEMVHGEQELFNALKRVFDGHDAYESRRERFVKEFIRPNGKNISAGEIQAQKIIETAVSTQ